MNGDTGKRRVQSVETACRIINELDKRDRAGVTELAEALNLAKATVHTQLQTLHDQEYVVQSGSEYRLGLRFLKLGESVKEHLGIYDIIRDELDDLAKETGEVAQFAVEEHGKAVYVYKKGGKKAVQTASYIGMREYMTCISLGKAMLAHMSEERVEEIIDRYGLPAYTEHTITDRDELLRELADIREKGYAVDQEEKIEGLECVASPVRIPNGVLGAVSVSGPSSRMGSDSSMEKVPDLTIRAANVIEINAKYS
jgi:DNA-binding IclR family transcriptional regulator